MKDFYSIYQLDRTMGLSEIQRRLDELDEESQQRFAQGYMSETQYVDEAAELGEARAVFASEEEREKYDSKLGGSVQADPNAERRASFANWYQKAQGFAASGSYDLADSAIQKAQGSVTPGQEGLGAFYAFAGSISLKLGRYEQGIRQINAAILEDSENLGYYCQKAELLDEQLRHAPAGQDRDALLANVRHAYELVVRKAADAGSGKETDQAAASAYGALAESYSHEEPRDIEKALAYAKRGAELGSEKARAVLQAKADADRKQALEERKEMFLRESSRKKAAWARIYGVSVGIAALGIILAFASLWEATTEGSVLMAGYIILAYYLPLFFSFGMRKAAGDTVSWLLPVGSALFCEMVVMVAAGSLGGTDGSIPWLALFVGARWAAFFYGKRYGEQKLADLS